MRTYFALAAAAVLLPIGAPSALANQPPRASYPLGASAGALWTDDQGAEHWLHVVGSVGAGGTTEVMADGYVDTPVTCPDGSTSSRNVTLMGGASNVGDVVIDKHLQSGVVTARLELERWDSGACGQEPAPMSLRTVSVALSVQSTSPAIHSLRIIRRRAGHGKPGDSLVTHATLRLASGTVAIGRSQHTTTEGMIARDASGLGGGSSTASTSYASLLSSSLLGPPSRWFREESGWYVSGEVHKTRDQAQPGHLLVDESAVNAAHNNDEPVAVYAGRHTTRVINCGGDLATVDTFWDGLGPGQLRIERSMRAGHVSATLPLEVQQYNACTGASSSWTTTPKAVRMDVVATTAPVTSRSIDFDHESAWTTARYTGWQRSRDGIGTYLIGAWHRAFDVGGILHWGRTGRTHTQRF